MSYQAGTRLGSYEILEKIGSGGMGDVYRARDVRLDRSVAIKVLGGDAKNVDPAARRARLQREAKAISKLSHPNICSLFDVGEHQGAYYLVLEHIEGKTLLDELTHRAPSLRDALRISAEVADGLAAAHREGIVHRDLKPGNVMLTRSGVKILDFGLARFAATESLEDDDEDRPTVSRALTADGVVVGTPWYMAPEQVTGETVDARTDIFALGIVLYEMIAGRRPFHGDAPSKVTASILKHDPPRLDDVVPECPPRVGQLVEACLAKDRDARWQSAGDLARELRWSMTADGDTVKPTARASHWAPWLVTGAVLLGVATWMLLSREDRFEIEALSVAAPPGTSFAGAHPALSPDGGHLAFIAADADGQTRLWVRNMITGEAERLFGLRDDAFLSFTPDGEELMWWDHIVKAFGMHDRVERVVFEGPFGPRGVARNDDGLLVMTQNNRSPLYLAREESNDARVLTELDEDAGEISHRHPQFLPDGEHFIFLAVTDRARGAAYLGSVREGKLEQLVETSSPAIYADGHLFFVRDSALFVQPLDTRSFALSGEATLILPSVGARAGFPANVAVSENGVLAYGPDPRPSMPTRLVWYDREGNELGELGEPADYRGIALSPDGERVAAAMGDPTTNSYDVWMIDGRGVSTRLTTEPLFDSEPVWAPSGNRILFSSDRAGGTPFLYVDSLDDEPPELLLDPDDYPDPSDWDRQNRIWFSLRGASGRDIWVWSDGNAEPFLVTEHDEFTPRVAPDGAWLAFVSEESGRREVYVQPLGRSGEKRRLSHDGGVQPRWRGDGRELFYVDLEGSVMAVNFEAAYTGRERAQALFRPSIVLGPGYVTGDHYAPTPDGQRFLVIEKPPDPPPFDYTVLLNWRRALARP